MEISTDLTTILALLFGGWLGWVAWALCSIYDRQIGDAFKFLKNKLLKRKEV